MLGPRWAVRKSISCGVLVGIVIPTFTQMWVNDLTRLNMYEHVHIFPTKACCSLRKTTVIRVSISWIEEFKNFCQHAMFQIWKHLDCRFLLKGRSINCFSLFTNSGVTFTGHFCAPFGTHKRTSYIVDQTLQTSANNSNHPYWQSIRFFGSSHASARAHGHSESTGQETWLIRKLWEVLWTRSHWKSVD